MPQLAEVVKEEVLPSRSLALFGPVLPFSFFHHQRDFCLFPQHVAVLVGGAPAGRLCMGSCPCKLCLLHPAYPQSKLEDVTDEFTFVSTGGCDRRRFRLSLNYLTWKISSGPFAVPVKLSLPVCGEVELGVRLAQEPVLVWRRGTLGRWQRIPCCSYLEGQCSDHHSLMDLMSYLALNYIPFLKSLVSALLFLYPGLLFSPFFFLSIVENTNRVYENWKTLGLPSLYNQQS